MNDTLSDHQSDYDGSDVSSEESDIPICDHEIIILSKDETEYTCAVFGQMEE
jgi:hypothetical protein